MNLRNLGFYKSNIGKTLQQLPKQQDNKNLLLQGLYRFQIMNHKKDKHNSLNKEECSFHNVISVFSLFLLVGYQMEDSFNLSILNY